MKYRIIMLQILYEEDVVYARQRARQIAKLCGFNQTEQIRISTAVSEISRNAFHYAGGGTVEFIIDVDVQPPILAIFIKDKGKGIPNINEIWRGEYRSRTGMGIGILGTRKLMEFFTIDTNENGTTVFMGKILPANTVINQKTIDAIIQNLTEKAEINPLEELRSQNKELIHALEELHKKQEELEQLNKELEETNRGVLALYSEISEKAMSLSKSNELKTKFISNMSHEFKTPINAILSLSRILLDKVDGDLTKEQEKQVHFIRHAAENLNALINDLLDLAKIEAGKVTVNISQFTVEDILSSLRGVIRPLLSNPDVILVFEEPINIPPLMTDDGKLSQILRNLLSNAIKFTEKGEIRVGATLVNNGRDILFTVKDTGIGISNSDIEKIFNEYVQVSKKKDGTGLGLSISRNLAKILGGELWAESEVGKGSTFYCRIPLIYSVPEASDKEEIRQLYDLTRVPVLVIEDDEVTRLLYDKYFKQTRFQMIPAASIKEAKVILKSLRPAAIILDILLPNEDSWQFLSELKSNNLYSSIPILCVSIVDEYDKGLLLGATDYIVKPIERNMLFQKITELTKEHPVEKILIIDDDEIVRYIFKGYLSDTRFIVIEAVNALDGLQKAKSEKPDVIFLDLIMPQMSGFEVLDRLKADPDTENIPVIILSSKILDESERAQLLKNTVAIISKEAPNREAAILKIKNAITKALGLYTQGGE